MHDVEDLNESSNYYIEMPQNNYNINFQKYISEKNDQENDNNKFKVKRIICEECNNFPKIYFNDDCYTIDLICNCKEYENMELDYFKKNFIIEEEEEMDNDKNKIKFDNYFK